MSGPFRVLYAEDNEQDADLTRFRFSEEAPDLEIEVVATGRACLERLSAERPDVLLLDNHLPDMDGLDVLRNVVASRLPVPVVLVTGVGDEDLVVKALRLGASKRCAAQAKPRPLSRATKCTHSAIDVDELLRRVL